MSQPEGHIKPGNENKICKLNYGLKQAVRAWNIKIGDSGKKLGFMQSIANQCLLKRQNANNTLYIAVYIDDLLIAGENKVINNVTEELQKEYKVKNLTPVNYYLGINIMKA